MEDPDRNSAKHWGELRASAGLRYPQAGVATLAIVVHVKELEHLPTRELVAQLRFNAEKKLSIGALSQQLPRRLMLPSTPLFSSSSL